MKSNIDKLEEYLLKMGEITSSSTELKAIEFFDRSFYTFIQGIFNVGHYKYQNPVVRIAKENGGYYIYTWVYSLSFEKSLKEYIKKCKACKDQPKVYIGLL